jgi:hypothetical protein
MFCIFQAERKTLNRIAYRLLLISDLLARVDGAKYFSKIGLLNGFYQIRKRKEDILKTTFTTPYGIFEFKVMPLRPCGAPSTFQYLMDTCFHEPTDITDTPVPFSQLIAVYLLDDICIFSSSEPIFISIVNLYSSTVHSSCTRPARGLQARLQTYQV